MRYFLSVCLLLTCMSFMSGCIPMVATAAGVGGSAALDHTLSGCTHRTFTASATKVRVATKRALSRMKIEVISEDMHEKNHVVFFIAKTSERKIEIQIEPISANATLMKVEAKSSLFTYDTSTSEEIIQQTKKFLG